MLEGKIEHLSVLYGGLRVKRRREIMEELRSCATGSKVILATGAYIGEGFDDSRLDTLFLAMPISFKGKVVQYVGRLHRQHKNKNDVCIYDYVDSSVPVLLRMYEKRLTTYKRIGYKVQTDGDQKYESN